MKNETVKTGMKIGATIGGLVFLVAGIVPGFYFGSFGTLILLQKMMGGTVEPTLFVRAAIVMGIGVGIASAATVSIVVGGLLGTAMGYIVSVPAALPGKEGNCRGRITIHEAGPVINRKGSLIQQLPCTINLNEGGEKLTASLHLWHSFFSPL